MKVAVTISRSAYHTLICLVDADSVEAGEQKVQDLLNRAQRTEIADLDKIGAKIISDTMDADDESSFEVLEAGEHP